MFFFFLISNFTSKLMDTDASLALLLPSLDQDCFQLTKEHCFHSETTKRLPQASKQNFIIHFVYSLSLSFGFLSVFVLGSVFFYLHLGYGYMCLELTRYFLLH